jgi:spore coat polysaccharide biosynthesis predicted glycosyltransferase SpsG
MKQILIITEGSTTLGMGHVYRTMALARFVRDGARALFLTASEHAVRLTIAENGFDVVHADRPYEDVLPFLSRPDVVVIDKLVVDETLAAKVKELTGARLAIFGNVSHANEHADVVVNAIVGTDFQNGRRVDPVHGTLYLEGPRFVILREEFYRQRCGYCYRGRLERVLLMFGGADPSNLMCRAAAALLGSNCSCHVTACVGKLYRYMNELNALESDCGGNGALEIVRGSSQVSALMLAHDCVVTSPGNTLFEAFALGVPSLAFYQNASQRSMFAGFYATHEPDDLCRLPELMQSMYSDYPAYVATTGTLAPGEGRAEIAAALLED